MHLRLVLANRAFSSWSMRAWLAARWSGLAPLPEELFVPLRSAEWEEKRALGLIAPNNKVPVLWLIGEDSISTCVYDSLAIAETLNEWAKGRLWPEDENDRMVARSIVAEMHSGFGALRTHMPFNVRRMKLNPHGPSIESASERAEVEADIAAIQKIWTSCRSRESSKRNGPYLFGEKSIADAFFVPVVIRFKAYDVKLENEIVEEYVRTVLEQSDVAEWVNKAMEEPLEWIPKDFDVV